MYTLMITQDDSGGQDCCTFHTLVHPSKIWNVQVRSVIKFKEKQCFGSLIFKNVRCMFNVPSFINLFIFKFYNIYKYLQFLDLTIRGME